MSTFTPPQPDKPEFAWEIARLFPPQGQWSESRYLSFSESLNQLLELVDGRVEVPEMPTKSHQKVVQYLLQLFLAFLKPDRIGDAVSAPYRIRLRNETYREPDIVVYLAEHLDRFGERYGEAADLVVEVVRDDPASRVRDYEDKRRDYADAGISEYWIVDPAQRRIQVLVLKDEQYEISDEFAAGDQAASRILSGFRADVDSVLHVGDDSFTNDPLNHG